MCLDLPPQHRLVSVFWSIYIKGNTWDKKPAFWDQFEQIRLPLFFNILSAHENVFSQRLGFHFNGCCFSLPMFIWSTTADETTTFKSFSRCLGWLHFEKTDPSVQMYLSFRNVTTPNKRVTRGAMKIEADRSWKVAVVKSFTSFYNAQTNTICNLAKYGKRRLATRMAAIGWWKVPDKYNLQLRKYNL